MTLVIFPLAQRFSPAYCDKRKETAQDRLFSFGGDKRDLNPAEQARQQAVLLKYKFRLSSSRLRSVSHPPISSKEKRRHKTVSFLLVEISGI